MATPWRVLADVGEVLEHSAAKRLDEDEKGMDIIHTPGGDREMLIISEQGLYKLLSTGFSAQ